MDLGEAPDSASCYDGPSVGGWVVGGFLIVGIALSYAFQVLHIALRRSVDGVSFVTLWLAVESASLTLFNTLIEDWASVRCVRYLGPLQAAGELLPLAQVTVGPASLLILYAVFLLYSFAAVFRLPYLSRPPAGEDELPGSGGELSETATIASSTVNPSSSTPSLSSSSSSASFSSSVSGLCASPIAALSLVTGTRFRGRASATHRALVASLVGLVGSASLLVALGVALFLLLRYDSQLQFHPVHAYADALGIAASVLVAIVWLPQIYTTLRERSPGSLSIEMLLLQAPGSVLVVIFQAVLANPPLPWSTWLPYIITSLEQFLLIGLWLFFTFSTRLRRWLRLDKNGSDASLLREDRPDSMSLMRHAGVLGGAGSGALPEELDFVP